MSRNVGKESRKNFGSRRLEHIRSVNSAVVRNQRTSRMEDYLEVIYELVRQNGFATATDISDSLNVSLPSVSKMMRKLDKVGYVDHEKYRGVHLTAHGVAVARSIQDRHDLLMEFFRILGIDQETASIDVEGIEHHLQPQTIKKLHEFVTMLKNRPISGGQEVISQ